MNRAGNGALDLSLLTDGLEAEREQGITIDVAYRYFATVRRKFIIADTPGHEQYTRNMVTGASTADAAVVLVDASRVAPDATGRIELLPQTRRHTALARLLGIRHVAVAVNKMDAVGFAQARFDAIVAAYRELAQRLDVPQFTPLAVSALDGDNVVTRSARMPWYDGPTLLEWLEDAPGASDDDAAAAAPLRFAVQLVLRSTADHHGGARRYAGRVGAGQVAVGDRVRLAPGGGDAQVVGIETFDGALAAAGPDGRSACASTASSTFPAATGWSRPTRRHGPRNACSPTSPGSTPRASIRPRPPGGCGCNTARAACLRACAASRRGSTSGRCSGRRLARTARSERAGRLAPTTSRACRSRRRRRSPSIPIRTRGRRAPSCWSIPRRTARSRPA